MKIKLGNLRRIIREEARRLHEAYKPWDVAGEITALDKIQQADRSKEMEEPDWSMVPNEQLQIALSAARARAVGNSAWQGVYDRVKTEVSKRRVNQLKMMNATDDDELDLFDEDDEDDELYQLGDFSELPAAKPGFKDLKDKELECEFEEDNEEEWWR